MGHYTSGLGLTVLKGFVKANNGGLTIFSGDGKFTIKGGKEKIETLACNIIGTSVIFKLKNKENVVYFLKNENPEEDIF